jgi:cell division transport system permease protein
MERLRALLISDIPFARDDAHRLLPAMIACLAGFTALLLALAVSLSAGVDSQAREVTGVLQIEVPTDTASNKEKFSKILAALRATAGVEQVNVLREADMEKLLKPWLGSDFSLDDLPVPTLLDVQASVKNGTLQVNLAQLKSALSAIDKSITIADRGPWVQHVARATALLQGLVVLIAALLMACVVGMIVLVARTNLKLHFKAVSLLHMFGATDEYILRQFQWNNALLSLRGAVTGVLFTALVFGGWVILSARWNNPAMPPTHFTLSHAATFLLLPLLTAVIAFVATRLTVQSMLRHMH